MHAGVTFIDFGLPGPRLDIDGDPGRAGGGAGPHVSFICIAISFSNALRAFLGLGSFVGLRTTSARGWRDCCIGLTHQESTNDPCIRLALN